MIKQNPQQNKSEDQGEILCDVCGSIKILEDGEYYCPKCDGEINFFGDEDEDDTQQI